MNDSIWATVLGISKIFNVTPDYALHDISYINAMMYSAATPTINDGDNEDKLEFDERLDANNPANFGDNDEEEIV